MVKEQKLFRKVGKITQKKRKLPLFFSRVMTTLCFNSVERDKYGSAGCNPEEDRIKEVQTQILAYGVEQKYMFKIDDILHKKNTPKVIRCLEEVAKLVSTKFSGTFTLTPCPLKSKK